MARTCAKSSRVLNLGPLPPFQWTCLNRKLGHCAQSSRSNLFLKVKGAELENALAETLRVKTGVISPLTIASNQVLPKGSQLMDDGQDTLSGSKSLVDWRYYEATDGNKVVSMIASRIQD